MSDKKRRKHRKVPIVIDGNIRINTLISKHTKCSDIIAKLPNIDIPLAVFVSVDGIENQLSSKTKLWKVWRDSASSKAIEFVVKTIEQDNKMHTTNRWLFATVKKFQFTSRPLKSSFKRISDLVLSMRNQKTKRESINGNKISQSNTKSLDRSITQDRLRKEISSKESLDSMKNVLPKSNVEKMPLFETVCYLNSCDSISNYQLPKSAIQHSFQTTKRSLKKTLTTNGSSVKSACSATSMTSTETGYYSTGINGEAHALPIEHFSKNFPTLEDHNHSTSRKAKSAHKIPASHYSTAMSAFTMKYACGSCRKDIIMQKFMDELSLGESCNTLNANEIMHTPTIRKSHTNGHGTFVTNYQVVKCQWLWHKYAESDSDTDESDSDLSNASSLIDNTFCDESSELYESAQSKNTVSQKEARKKATASNLNQYLSAKLSVDPISNEFSNRSSDDSIGCSSSSSMDHTYSADCSFSSDSRL